jgi:hypothetical protein
MIKKLIYLAAVTLLSAASVSVAYENPARKTEKYPHIVGSVQFPQTKERVVRHTFRVQIPEGSSALSQLKVSVPPGLTVRNDITVHDRAGREIDANTSVNGNTVTIDFHQSVKSATRVEIDMNRVVISGVSNAWLYHVWAKIVEFDTELSLGVARFKVY